MHLLDMLFPKRCVSCKSWGSYICANCFAKVSYDVEMMCVECNRAAIDGVTHPGCKKRYSVHGVLSAVKYNGVMKKALYAYKYAPFVKQVGQPLLDLFYEGMIQKELFFHLMKRNPVLVPIPLHPEKLKSRGYNQADILAKGLGDRCTIPVVQALYRQKKTRSQFSLSRDERKENIQDAFAIRTDVVLTPEMPLLLIDDIVTTGATLSEATKVLKKAGIKEVWGVTLAHGK